MAREVVNLLREKLRGRGRCSRWVDCQSAVDLHGAEEPGWHDFAIEWLGVRVEDGLT